MAWYKCRWLYGIYYAIGLRFMLWFGMKFGALPIINFFKLGPGPRWKSSDREGLRIRKLKWWLGRIIIQEDFVIGTFSQFIAKMGMFYGIPEDLDSMYGKDLPKSNDLYQFDIINWRFRKITLIGSIDGNRNESYSYWFKPSGKWFRPKSYWRKGNQGPYVFPITYECVR